MSVQCKTRSVTCTTLDNLRNILAEKFNEILEAAATAAES